MKLEKLLQAVAIHEVDILKKFLSSKPPHPEEVGGEEKASLQKEFIIANTEFDLLGIERILHQQGTHTSYTFRFKTIEHLDIEDDVTKDLGEYSQMDVKLALRKMEVEEPTLH